MAAWPTLIVNWSASAPNPLPCTVTVAPPCVGHPGKAQASTSVIDGGMQSRHAVRVGFENWSEEHAAQLRLPSFSAMWFSAQRVHAVASLALQKPLGHSPHAVAPVVAI